MRELDGGGESLKNENQLRIKTIQLKWTKIDGEREHLYWIKLPNCTQQSPRKEGLLLTWFLSTACSPTPSAQSTIQDLQRRHLHLILHQELTGCVVSVSTWSHWRVGVQWWNVCRGQVGAQSISRKGLKRKVRLAYAGSSVYVKCPSTQPMVDNQEWALVFIIKLPLSSSPSSTLPAG